MSFRGRGSPGKKKSPCLQPCCGVVGLHSPMGELTVPMAKQQPVTHIERFGSIQRRPLPLLPLLSARRAKVVRTLLSSQCLTRRTNRSASSVHCLSSYRWANRHMNRYFVRCSQLLRPTPISVQILPRLARRQAGPARIRSAAVHLNMPNPLGWLVAADTIPLEDLICFRMDHLDDSLEYSESTSDRLKH